MFLGGRDSRAGVVVDEATAFQVSSILCAARIVAQGLAQVPLKLFEEVDEDNRVVRKTARTHPVYRLLAEQPNEHQTAFTFRETLLLHAVLTGNGYAFINRRDDQTVRELWPMAPDEVTCAYKHDTREVRYELTSGGRTTSIPSKDVLHLHGPSWNGFSGLRALELAREAIGLSVALERGHGELYSKGGRPSGILAKEGDLSAEAREHVAESWHERFGPGGDGGIAVLDGDWSFSPLSMTAVDAQYIETRRFQLEEIARFMVIFPQMLMQADKPTYASVEQFFIAHVVHTLDPWMDRLEQEIKRSVIGYEGNNQNVYPRHAREGLLRGAVRDRFEAYGKALGSGGHAPIMTVNEIRALENLNPMDGGDALVMPTNTQTKPIEDETDDVA